MNWTSAQLTKKSPAEHQSQLEPKLPFVLAIVLLVIQLILPWTIPHFVTQDGPSHVYSAITARDLLIHRDSLQQSLYHIRPGIIPNWTSTILIAAIATVAGAGNAERVMVDICIILGFFSFRYAARALAGVPLGFTPLANFLFHTWFLWLGFFNFALGMALFPFIIGYFVRHRRVLTVKHTAVLAAATTLLFFTHLIPSAIAVLTVVTVALWTHGKTLLARPALYRTGLAIAAMLPTITLTVLYATGGPAVGWKPDFDKALADFPMHAFATAAGRVGEQELLVPGVLLYIVIAILSMRRAEWRSERGALAATMLIAFIIYLVVPDAGLGGSMTKIRFVWVVFILGGLVAASAAQRPMERPLAICIAVLLSCNLFVTWQALSLTSRAVADYVSATDRIPPGAVFVRLFYPTPNTSEHYGLKSMGRNPFFHLDAYSAFRRGSVDLSDYESVNPIFPLALGAKIDEGQQYVLWSLEGPGEQGADSLAWLSETLPVPIEYVVLVSDDNPAQSSSPGLAKVSAKLEAEMRLVAMSPGRFVRVYERMDKRLAGAAIAARPRDIRCLRFRN